jgi:predicted DCC family thiol-disulfide oxidoreductase YuxK
MAVETSGAVARSGPLERPLILYQDRCPVCRASARLLERLDKRGRLALLPFDDPAAAEFVVFLERGRIEESWQLIECDGRRLTHGDAFLRLLEIVDRTRWIARALKALRLERLAGAVDWAISRSRPYLARVVRNGPAPRRWP